MLARTLYVLPYFLFTSQLAAQVSCGDAPKDVPVEVQQELKGDVEGKAQFFTKLLGDAKLKGQIETSKRELYEKHINIGKSEIDRYTMWVSCQIIMSDKTMTAKQKHDLWLKVYYEITLSNLGEAPDPGDKPTPADDAKPPKPPGLVQPGVPNSGQNSDINFRISENAKEYKEESDTQGGFIFSAQAASLKKLYGHFRLGNHTSILIDTKIKVTPPFSDQRWMFAHVPFRVHDELGRKYYHQGMMKTCPSEDNQCGADIFDKMSTSQSALEVSFLTEWPDDNITPYELYISAYIVTTENSLPKLLNLNVQIPINH